MTLTGLNVMALRSDYWFRRNVLHGKNHGERYDIVVGKLQKSNSISVSNSSNLRKLYYKRWIPN